MSRLARIVRLAARLSTVVLSGPTYVGARRISSCFPLFTYIAEQATVQSPDQHIRSTSECNVFRTPGDGNGSERFHVAVDHICREVL
jgi:hypothetical protein